MRGLALAAWLAAAGAPSCAQEWRPVPRKILALYNPAKIAGNFKDVAFLPLHLRAEMALNYLGLEVVYQDATKPLPDPSTLGDYRGIVAWYLAGAYAFDDPRPVCRWMSAALRAGKRVVVLGEPGLFMPGADGKPALPAECEEALSSLGLAWKGKRPVDALSVAVARADPRVMGFERKLDPSETGAVPVVEAAPGAKEFLRLALREGKPDHTVLVAATSRGGFALDPFFLYENRELDPAQYRWIVNPFVFFDAAFAVAGLPRPDVTTINGRRAFFTQVDGDGFFNRSELDRKKWSGEVFLNEIVEKYPTLPMTLSLITGYFDLTGFGGEDSLALCRRLFRAPNVEPASHGYAHPEVWHTGELALSVPGYRFDARREILGALDFINKRLLPPTAPTHVFLWTGDRLPSEKELAMAEDAGVVGLNGGGGRFDRRFPSYSFLFPLSRRVGARLQVYAPFYAENEYTNLWTGPFYGYREVIESFEKTAAPRRVAAVNVYAHFYSAEKYSALQSLRRVYDWVVSQPLTAIRASDYVRMARGFFAMRVSRAGARRFLLEGGQDLRTVRFDGETSAPDLDVSRGVIGYRHELGSLYVFLAENAPREVVLGAGPAKKPYLSEANFEVFGWRREGGGVRFSRRGWQRGEFRLGGLSPGGFYRVKSAGFSARLRADAFGALSAAFPDSELGGPAREVVVEAAP